MIRKYRVLFLGLSSNKEDFKLRMVRLGAPPETIDQMIERAPIILKEGLTSKNSRLYADAVQEAGGIIEVLEYESVEEPEILLEVQDSESHEDTKTLAKGQDAAPLKEPEDLPRVQNLESLEEPEVFSDTQDFELLEELENLSDIREDKPSEKPEKHPISIIPFKDFTMCPECGLKQQKSEVCVKCGFRLVRTEIELEPKNVAGH